MPCWYYVPMIVLSLYYAIRGLMEQMHKHSRQHNLSKAYKVIVVYIQEMLFKIIFTASGFIALFTANYIFSMVTSINEIGVGTAILLIFLVIWGITGISGYLTYLVVRGRLPGLTK